MSALVRSINEEANEGCAMVYKVSYWPITTEAQVSLQSIT